MSDSGDNPKREGSLQGRAVAFDEGDVEGRAEVIEQAFDYRGDVTLELVDGRSLTGYLFDRRRDGDRPYVRMFPNDGGDRVRVDYAEIRRLSFSGRDTAAGKSWETWVAQHKEKKARGEQASREPEVLDG